MDIEKRETAFAKQYLKLKGRKLKCKAAWKIMHKMGFTKTLSTMNRHIACLRRTGHALSLVKKDSSHSSLNADQMSNLNTWILGQNSKNSPIGYADVQKYINDNFNIKVFTRTAGNILHRLGHTRRPVRVKPLDLKKQTPN
jgi:transposase